MRSTPQIIWQNLSPSEEIEAKIRKHITKLEKFTEQLAVCASNRLSDCRVVIEVPHRHHHQGNIYHVQINLTVPGSELVVNRQPQAQQTHEDLHVAIRDAFDSAERQLKDYLQQRRGEIKTHVGGESDDRDPIPQSL
jgi:ribosome-associated translation inhibitor RaiA